MNYYEQQLGATDWGSIAQAGASIFSSISSSSAEKQSNLSAERQLQLQLQAQQAANESKERLVKIGLIAGGVLVIGSIVTIAIVTAKKRK